MPIDAANRLLNPAVLHQIANLELVAKTVVDGFVAGLHRSPDFGFSQEFAEYRAYSSGDDLRHVDWNVYARADRMFLKRYRGETNTSLTVLLDVSASMGYGSGSVRKIEYAKFLAAALVYLANLQRDTTGLIVFADEVTNFVQPSSRSGQLLRLLHGIDQAQLGTRTNFQRPFLDLQQFQKKRGITAILSDFFENPETIIKTVEPLRQRGSEMILFHILDPHEIEPTFGEAALLLDMETGDSMETSPEYARVEYKQKIQAHLESMHSKAQGAGIDYQLLRTDKPLDGALREYFRVRGGKM